MKKIVSGLFMALSFLEASAQSCTPLGNETSYGTNNTWIGYVYDNINLTGYRGFVNEGNSSSPNFDQSFGGSSVSYATNGCPVTTTTFSVRYRLRRVFSNGAYQFTVGGDDGYRLSLDGGATWVINRWNDQSYNTSTYTTMLNGPVDMVLEYYENAGDNRITFNLQSTCLGTGNQNQFGSGNVWRGYLYSGTNFNTYKGSITRGNAGNPNFDENFGGANTNFTTSDCNVPTENFSARFRLSRHFTNGTYIITVGGDDGYRFSLDGGVTWAINRWNDQSYGVTSITRTLNGNYDLVIEFYENSGQNRLSFDISNLTLSSKLGAFDWKQQQDDLVLFWSSLTEEEQEGYIVEKSENNRNFKPIGRVRSSAPNGNSQNPLSYQFTDPSGAMEKAWYRLGMLGKNGQISYSNIIYYPGKTGKNYTVFPTIITNNSVQIRTPKAGERLEIELYDLSGRKLASEKLVAAGNNDRQSILFSQLRLRPGMYRLRVVSDGQIRLQQAMLAN